MVMLDRRALIAGAVSVTGVVALPRFALAAMPANGTYRYQVLRNGKPFGTYTLAFATAGDSTTVTTDVAMQAKVAGLTVFNYRHHCEEIWKAVRFQEMHSQSQRDGDKDFCTAVRSANGGINITNKNGPLLAPPSANPYTHWNCGVLQGPLFNPETGFMLRLSAQSMGHEPFVMGNGARASGLHWAVRGENDIDEWYDDAGMWMGLRAVFPDKSIVEYRRL